jgi:large subunit ribosomal protein L31
VKPDIHPKLNPVLFRDVSTGKEWVSRSTRGSADRVTVDGVEHHLINLEVSSDSHPFFTGRQRLMDTEGRIDRFRRKFGGKA